MTEPRILEPTILDAIERYFELLQGHASAQEMTERVLTDDFETGFVGGYMWRGPDGLAAFLADRSVFFDESHEILQLMDIIPASAGNHLGTDPAAVLPAAA
jgi:hypothetical protein